MTGGTPSSVGPAGGVLAVGVLGARGRMGTTTCDAVNAADDMALVAQVDAGDDFAALSTASVVVDFTAPTR